LLSSRPVLVRSLHPGVLPRHLEGQANRYPTNDENALAERGRHVGCERSSRRDRPPGGVNFSVFRNMRRWWNCFCSMMKMPRGLQGSSLSIPKSTAPITAGTCLCQMSDPAKAWGAVLIPRSSHPMTSVPGRPRLSWSRQGTWYTRGPLFSWRRRSENRREVVICQPDLFLR
jgi:hypothetical protein